jgi:hypothetical protein
MPATPLPALTNAMLTEKTVGGAGTFDILMSSMSEHLRGEYSSGRIAGAEYTKAYIGVTQAVLNAAVQYLLGRDLATFQTRLTQEQIEGILIDNQSKTYTLQNILPKQANLLQEQIEVQRAQTLDTRTDAQGVVGLIGKQKDLYSQQITSYKRDAETKAVKIFADAWITQKTVDEGLLAPMQFTNNEINNVISSLRQNLLL